MVMSLEKTIAKKVVVITGVGRGLGRAMAREFVAQGHYVAGCSRDKKKLLSLAKDLGDSSIFSQVNVADDFSVQEWAVNVIQELGAPDLLINNAAVINKNQFLWDLRAEEFSEVIDVNIKGVANVIRHFVKPMAKAGRGIIVNFSSGWGRSASPEVAPYCATKWAIEGMTQSLALELPEGLAAVPLNPGVINTDMLRSCFGPSAADFPSADEWATIAVPFLLQLSSKNNGQSLTLS